LLGIALIAEIIFLSQVIFIWPRSDYIANIITSALIDGTNQNRTDRRQGTLTPNSTLEKAAKAKAEDMAAKGYFAHNSPEGLTPWYWLRTAGYDYAYGGENLAINFYDSKDVINAWMNSPAHRANILNNNFTEIGVATAEGYYRGTKAVFIVQYFGRPKAVAASPTLLPSRQPVPPRTPVQTVREEVVTPTFVKVMGAEDIAAEPAPIQLEKTESMAIENFSSENILASPRQTTNYIYMALLIIIAFSIILTTVAQKFMLKHPKLILRGAIFIFVLLILMIFNKEVASFSSSII
jgi:hypothetical protein